MSTLEKIEKIQTEIQKDVNDYHHSFLELFEEYKGTDTEKFIEKFIDWYTGVNSLLLFHMFYPIVAYCKHTFFFDLKLFVINYFYDDSLFRIVWIHKNYYNEFRKLLNIRENISIPEHFILDENDKNSCPVVIDDDVWRSDNDYGSQEPSKLIEAMEKYETKESNRQKEYESTLQKFYQLSKKFNHET